MLATQQAPTLVDRTKALGIHVRGAARRLARDLCRAIRRRRRGARRIRLQMIAHDQDALSIAGRHAAARSLRSHLALELAIHRLLTLGLHARLLVVLLLGPEAVQQPDA